MSDTIPVSEPQVEAVARAIWNAWAQTPTFKKEWDGISWETIADCRSDLKGAYAIYETAMIEARAAITAYQATSLAGSGGAVCKDSLRTDSPVADALEDVAAERKRQIEQEGWTPEHDDKHSHGQMARAAACYALGWMESTYGPSLWPRDWAISWWKPTTRRRDLIKAAALIVAEIERLDRANGRQS